MAAYETVRRTGSLKLKGVKVKKNKRKSEQSTEESGENSSFRYGVWWHAKVEEDLVGTAFIETDHRGFLSARDDGTLGVAPPPEARERPEEYADDPLHPDAEDLFSIVRVSENRIALKTAFGRFVSCDEMGTVTARMEAMGAREMWQPMWKDPEAGVLVLRSSSRGYLVASRDPAVRARADKQTIEDATMFRKVWSSTDRSARKAKSDLVEDRTDSLTTVEEDYTKKFQAGPKVRASSETTGTLKRAKREGTLHEALLDRREKMKADRYCK